MKRQVFGSDKLRNHKLTKEKERGKKKSEGE